ncbi:MAG: hypothetical protein NTW07_12555 [candidate division Zixibacteria bacterium]|nr:hypothetical protein [candidate division Zixibacteria bacterium]
MVLIVVALAGCSSQPPADPMVLVNSERAFASALVEKGSRDAFLEFSDYDAVMFLPGAIRVKNHFRFSARSTELLSWLPTYAEIASSGDMGWTTGPWEWREKPTDSLPLGTGHYVTIWKQQADSTWKFVLNIGVAHRAPITEPSTPTLHVMDQPNQRERVEPSKGREEMLGAEYAFRAASVAGGLVSAFRSYLTPDARYYRMGIRPIQGIDSVCEILTLAVGTCTWEVEHAEVSENSDLGYTYGLTTLTASEGTAQFTFVRIWHRSIEGIWKVALDIQLPLPPKEKTP